ncbi:uncharacterized protein LOC134186699 isoform X2 [Corticium candelabrum]|nr:uncharacterized protein LOC134186699 isoform X2 [Corticium candelabrum]
MGPRGVRTETGRMDHDQTNNREAVSLQGMEGERETTFTRIALYHHDNQEGMRYTIQGAGNETHCEHRPLPGDLRPYWGFLMNADFERETNYMGKDAFEFTFHNMESRSEGTILVDAMQTSIPLLVNHTHGDEFAESTEYRTFVPGPPPASDFEIPASCRERRV